MGSTGNETSKQTIQSVVGNLDACKRQSIPCRILIPLCLLFSQAIFADARVTPVLAFRGYAVENEENTDTESGYITTVSPGFVASSEGPRIDFSIDYAFDVISNHDIDQEDREVHQLELASNFRHVPDRWASYLRAGNSLTNADVNGAQSSNPEIFSDNSVELATVALGTAYTQRLVDEIRFSTEAAFDYADREDSDSTTGKSIGASVGNFESRQILNWRFDARSELAEIESDDDESQIDTLGLEFDYRFSQKVSAFLELTSTDTEFDELNEDTTIVGLRWQPTTRSFFSLGVGKREDEDTYSLDARISQSRSTYTATYSETVSSVRGQLFELSEEEVAESTTQSISITPVLLKRLDLAISTDGIRSKITLLAFREEESNPEILVDEIVRGVEFRFDRRLSPRSSFSVSSLVQETESIQESRLEEARIGYERSTSRTAELEFFVSRASFESSNQALDSDRTVKGVAYRKTF